MCKLGIMERNFLLNFSFVRVFVHYLRFAFFYYKKKTFYVKYFVFSYSIAIVSTSLIIRPRPTFDKCLANTPIVLDMDE